MTSNNNFESTLKKSKQEAKKAMLNQQFTEFFVLNEQRKVIEFLVTSNNTTLLEYYFKQLLPEELRDFVTLQIQSESDEVITHWYFNEEVISLLFTIDWGDSKQEIFLEIDSEQFEMLITNQNGFGVRVFDYKLCNEFIKQVIKSQAKIIIDSYEELKVENSLKNSKTTNLKDYF